MPLFPHGRPTDLLGQSSSLPTMGTDDHSETNSDNSSTASGDTVNKKRKKDRQERHVVPWVEYDIVHGWQSDHNAFNV